MTNTKTWLAVLCAALAAAPAGAAVGGLGQDVDKAATGALTSGEALGLAQTANKAEIEAATLALKKASSGEVKKFAQRMLDDHTKSQQEIAQSGAAQDSPASRGFEATAKADLQKLQGLSGGSFDKAYLDSQVGAHTALLNELNKVQSAGGGAGADLLGKTRATVADHVQMAKQAQGTLSR